MTTSQNITDHQIELLRAEAAEAGDQIMVRICDDALIGVKQARVECAQVIADAESMAAE